MRRILTALAVVTLSLAAVSVGRAGPRPHAGAQCTPAPRVVGLTLAAGRRRAARSGCRIRVAGAPILGAYGQRVQVSGGEAQRRIARQARPGGPSLEVWLVPECAQMAAPGPPPGEPFVRRGPTELISGLFVAGGPLEVFAGRCRKGVPVAGTITVADAASGTVLARVGVAEGRLATIPLRPGSYALSGSFAGATSDGRPITSSASVRIRSGRTTRMDVVASLP